MLHREDVGIEICYPLFTFLSNPQITQCITDIWPHRLPKEIGVIVSKIRNAFVAQFIAHPGLAKLVKQGGLLSQVIDVGKLSNQISRTHKSWKIIRRFMLLIVGHRETRMFDVFFQSEGYRGRSSRPACPVSLGRLCGATPVRKAKRSGAGSAVMPDRTRRRSQRAVGSSPLVISNRFATSRKNSFSGIKNLAERCDLGIQTHAAVNFEVVEFTTKRSHRVSLLAPKPCLLQMFSRERYRISRASAMPSRSALRTICERV
jgi:hypothetical protein